MVLGLLFKLIPTYGNLCRMLAFVVGLVWPTLESFKAIESKQLGDDTQWLMYWVCYATLITLEQVAWGFLIWIPFYRLLRVGALAWLALPQLRGATLVYESLVRPFLLVAVEKARELPALEPYATQFLPAVQRGGAGKPALSTAEPPSGATAGAGAADVVEETFEKAKQQAASATEEEEEDRPAYLQPLKSHAQ